MRITVIFILLIISLSSIGQLVDEYNKFISDTTLTSWKEFYFSPGSFDDKNYLEYSAYKDLKSKMINEKIFDYHNGLEDWTVAFYNDDWKIVKEIELNSDSTIIMIEELTYMQDGSIISKCFDPIGNIDSTTIYTYFPDGILSSYKFLIKNNDSSYSWHYGNYIGNKNGELIRKEEYNINENGLKTLEKYENYYSSAKLDSIITFDRNNEIIAKKIIQYENGKTRKVINKRKGRYTETEIYVFNNENLITILGYNKSYGSIRTIRIE